MCHHRFIKKMPTLPTKKTSSVNDITLASMVMHLQKQSANESWQKPHIRLIKTMLKTLLAELSPKEKNELARIFAKPEYINTFIDLCIYLQKIKQWTVSNLKLFIGYHGFLCYDQIETAFKRLEQANLHHGEHYISLILSLPVKALMLVDLIIQRENDSRLRYELKVEEYCALLADFLNQDNPQILSFEFEHYLSEYIKDRRKKQMHTLWEGYLQTMVHEKNKLAESSTISYVHS